MNDMNEPPAGGDFYIGYENRMPAAIRRRVVAVVAVFATGAVAAAALAVFAPARLPDARFAFGTQSHVTGVFRRDPYPSLEVDGRRVWLVGTGKFGAERMLEGIEDGPLTVSGSWIERGRHRMLEVHQTRPGTGAARVTLRGEIVDSKCFLGVMNPGEGAVHRDCAARCLHGGMPPMLLVRDGKGREELVVLVSENGAPAGRLLARLAGRPIEVTGRLVREGEEYVLFARGYKPAN